MIRITAAFLIAFAFIAPAQAHHHHYRHHHQRVARIHIAESKGFLSLFQATLPAHASSQRPHGCPYRWCGCGTSLRVFGRIIPELNLAANWRRFPSAIAAAGMVAWRWGHVFYIESVNSDGTVVAYDPNSGHHVAHVHTISLRGFHVVNPRGSRYANMGDRS
jgi:hypothetical protein